VAYTRKRLRAEAAGTRGEAMTSAGSGVVVHAVTKSLGEGTRRHLVVDGVSLSIGRGEFVSIIGPSGCGKSTLLKLVAGLAAPDEGQVLIDGASAEAAARAKAIGLVPQEPALLPWRTVRSNVELALRVNRRANTGRTLADPVEILSSLGLGEALSRYPAQLSGGMQQRVAIARAYAFNPDVLLMDEPFSALDEFTRERARVALLHFWQAHRKAVLFVTHSVAEAVLLSDRIVVMSPQPGRIREIVNVTLPRPRSRKTFEDPGFPRIQYQIQQLLHSVSGGRESIPWESTEDEPSV